MIDRVVVKTDYWGGKYKVQLFKETHSWDFLSKNELNTFMLKLKKDFPYIKVFQKYVKKD